MLVFGAFVAAGVSLILALVTIGVTIGGVIAIGTIIPQSFFIVNIVMMIGLAVGIDYALLIIERYREERRQGLDKHEAIVATGRTASRAVLFSGGTVMLALIGLFIVPITTFRSLGLGAVLVVGIAVLAMLTLVPALISLLGDRLDWPVLRRKHKLKIGERVHSGVNMYRGFWGGLTKQVIKRPVARGDRHGDHPPGRHRAGLLPQDRRCGRRGLASGRPAQERPTNSWLTTSRPARWRRCRSSWTARRPQPLDAAIANADGGDAGVRRFRGQPPG